MISRVLYRPTLYQARRTPLSFRRVCTPRSRLSVRQLTTFQENCGCQDSSQASRQDPCAVLPHRRRRLAHQARRSRDRGDRQVPPTQNPSFIEVDSDRAQYWLSVGAQPTEQVAAILKLTGDWGKFKGDKNAVSTVQVAEPKAAFVADEKKKPVLKPKAEKPAAKVEEAPAETATDEA